jgi:hypothetical protein
MWTPSGQHREGTSGYRHVARHLFQGESGYFAKMAVPLDLRPIIGKKEHHRYAHGFVDTDHVAALRDVISGAADNQGFLDRRLDCP